MIPGRTIPEKTIPIRPSLIADLTLSARAAATRAHAPYSGFSVGAALVMSDDPEGRQFAGCNVENASYGATICAERNAIHSAAAAGFRRIGVLVVSTTLTLEGPIEERSPCGVCRQVIREFADERTLIVIDSGVPGVLGEVVDIDRLLPWGFVLDGEAP
ncbi:MAG: cytidine deaminase [Verrucomicrobiae bacterium]|nr:cytidine deaminase [Verrucomicrobiae bacterium]